MKRFISREGILDGLKISMGVGEKSGFATEISGNWSGVGMHRLWNILEGQSEFEVNLFTKIPAWMITVFSRYLRDVTNYINNVPFIIISWGWI